MHNFRTLLIFFILQDVLNPFPMWWAFRDASNVWHSQKQGSLVPNTGTSDGTSQAISFAQNVWSQNKHRALCAWPPPHTPSHSFWIIRLWYPSNKKWTEEKPALALQRSQAAAEGLCPCKFTVPNLQPELSPSLERVWGQGAPATFTTWLALL